MSEKLDHISPKAMEDAVNEAWRLLATAIELRDNLGVPSEVLRVARVLCSDNGHNPDALVHYGQPVLNGRNHWRIFPVYLTMAWRPYVSMATIAIANMEAHRQEEDDRLKQQEKSYDNETAKAAPDLKAVDIPVGFSGMNDGEDVKFVAIDPSNPNRVTDSLSHTDLAAMVEFLATIFDEGHDGDNAVCRQTGEPFFTVSHAYQFGHLGTQMDQMARQILIRLATTNIMQRAAPGQNTLYWRKRPEIRKDGIFLRFYARVAFGP